MLDLYSGIYLECMLNDYILSYNHYDIIVTELWIECGVCNQIVRIHISALILCPVCSGARKLNFLKYKMWMIVKPPLQGCHED